MNARTLVAHAESGYEEWGVAGSVTMAPGRGGRGASLSTAPKLGSNAQMSTGLWNAPDATNVAPQGHEAVDGTRFDMRLGYVYGLAGGGGALTATPWVGLGVGKGGRDLRMGYRITPAGANPGDFSIELEAVRRESAASDDDHGIRATLSAAW